MTRTTPEDARRLVAKSRGAQPESAILNQVRDWLRWRGWFVIRMQQGLGSHKGLSDLVCIRDGETVWVEVKTAKGKQSMYQVMFEDDIKTHGGRYLVARCVEDVEVLE